MLRIGLISDTHGLLRPAALDFLQGCDHILHGGDIGGPGVLEVLRELAPVSAVRGNNDNGPWADALPPSLSLVFEEVRVHVVHDIADLALDPGAGEVRVVVSGHSHKPSLREDKGVLYVNPGSAGRRRFKLPIALGELHIDGATAVPRIVEISS